MQLTLQQLTKDLAKVDLEDILSSWRWKLERMRSVVTVSCIGDIFLLGDDNAIYWLQTDTGELTQIADSIEQYQQFLKDEDKVDNWFLPLLVEKLITAGKNLQANQVYSCKKPVVLGGEYAVDNMDAVDMSVHFAFAGQIAEQIKDLPDGTRVHIKFNKSQDVPYHTGVFNGPAKQ